MYFGEFVVRADFLCILRIILSVCLSLFIYLCVIRVGGSSVCVCVCMFECVLLEEDMSVCPFYLYMFIYENLIPSNGT